MTKDLFIKTLNKKLKAISKTERMEVISFYEEFFNESESEEVALKTLGDPNEIAKSILVNFTEKKGTISLKTIILIVFTSPLTLSLGAIGLAGMVVILTIVLSIFAILLSLFVSSIFVSIITLILTPLAFTNSLETGFILLGYVLVAVPLSYLLFKFGKFLAIVIIQFTKKILLKLVKRGQTNEK